MSTTTHQNLQDLRRRAKRRIDTLTPERLRVADDFLAYLTERESDDATAELLKMPEMLESFERGKKDIAASRTTDWRKVRRDV